MRLDERRDEAGELRLCGRQIILAAEISVEAPDFGSLEPMLNTTLEHLDRNGVAERPDAVVADAGYWHTRQIETITERGYDVLVPPEPVGLPGHSQGAYPVPSPRQAWAPCAPPGHAQAICWPGTHTGPPPPLALVHAAKRVAVTRRRARVWR